MSTRTNHLRGLTVLCLSAGLTGAPGAAAARVGVQPTEAAPDGEALRLDAEASTETESTATTDDAVEPAVAPRPVTAAPLRGAQRLDADGLFAAEQEAYRHYMRGKTSLEAGDAVAAIEAWEQALQTLPDERPYARSRGSLALNLVRAEQLRYRVTGDPDAPLRQVSLLLGYQERLPEMFPDDRAAAMQRDGFAADGIERAMAEIDRVQGEHGTADEQLEKSLRGEYTVNTEASWGFEPWDLGWHPRPDDPRKHGEQATDAEVAPEQARDEPTAAAEVRPAGVGLIVSGAVLTAAGIGGLAVGLVGMRTAQGANDFSADDTPAQRRTQINRGELANQQALGGLIAGGVVAGVGIVLLAVGANKRKRSGRTVAVRPAAGRTAAGARTLGATIAGRF